MASDSWIATRAKQDGEWVAVDRWYRSLDLIEGINLFRMVNGGGNPAELREQPDEVLRQIAKMAALVFHELALRSHEQETEV